MDPRSVTLFPAAVRPRRVLCAGLIASDFLTRTAFPVPRDVKVRVQGFVRQGGGPAANAAVALARLGVPVGFLGAVGGDATGREQIAELEAEGVDASHVVTRPGTPSFVAFILVDASGGARTIFSAPAERPVLPESVPLPAPAPDVLLLDGWAGPAAARLARETRAAGGRVVLDAGTLTPESEALLGEVDVAIVSEPFARDAAGSSEDALGWLRERGPRLFAVTEGERGVVAGASDSLEAFRVPAFPVDAVDTTGAGDAFHAGAVWGMAEGCSWEQCLRRGAAVAALQCREMGARAGLPGRAAAEARLAG